jgi:Uma2 family endonuclease
VSLSKSQQTISVQDYLEGEKDSPIRHEYVEGHLYAMAGASDRHNRAALNVASRLNQHLVDGPCEVFMSDMKLKVSANVYYYPDISVCCDAAPRDPYFREEPVLIIEVLSPTTERIDQHEKLVAYRGMPSLRQYVLISQDQILVQVHRRAGQGWQQETLTHATDLLALDSVGLNITLAEVYRGVRFAE